MAKGAMAMAASSPTRVSAPSSGRLGRPIPFQVIVVPLLVLPLYVPLLIAVARATEPFLTSHPGPHGLAKWLGFTGVYDTVFLLVAVAVFDYLLED